MGWDVDPTWKAKSDVVRDQLAGISYPYEVIDSKSTTHGLWMLVKRSDTGKLGLYFDLIERHGATEWAVKSMDEAMGPCYYDCPARFIKATNKDNCFTFNASWREQYAGRR